MTRSVAVLGGGITGLTAAYYLRKQEFDVDVFEKAPVLGGLAHGFHEKHWEWPLEYAYHHLFKNDIDIRAFAQEIGYDGIYFSVPHTDSLYKVGNDYRIIPVDSPQDFLKFPLLSPLEKLRAASILAGLKISPALHIYEGISAEDFVKTYMGDRMWKVFFEQLFRKKFGKYSGNVLASFLWARIHKRTRELGYMHGGFQSFINFTEKALIEQGVHVYKGMEVPAIIRNGEMFKVGSKLYSHVVSTLPSPVLMKVGENVLPGDYIKKLKGLNYLHALVLILETKNPILDKTYWLNICTDEIPLMFVGQHTNFVDPKHYGGNHIAYIGYYLERDDPKMLMTKEELVSFIKPHLEAISQKKLSIKKSYVFKGPFAQPIFDSNFLQNKPAFITPVKNFYIANLDMTYPYDRGTNYAVKLGKEVAALV